MRDKLKDKDRLEHILAAIRVIMDNRDKYSFETIVNEPIIFYGFVKQIEIIGEAVYKLTKEFRSLHPEIEWDVIEGMRHVLVHGYYTIRPKQLWTTVLEDIPELEIQVRELYEKFC